MNHVRRAMCDVRRALCDVRRALCDVRRALCDVRRALCDVRRADGLRRFPRVVLATMLLAGAVLTAPRAQDAGPSEVTITLVRWPFT